jgi:transposase
MTGRLVPFIPSDLIGDRGWPDPDRPYPPVALQRPPVRPAVEPRGGRTPAKTRAIANLPAYPECAVSPGGLRSRARRRFEVRSDPHPAAQTHDYTRHGTTTLFAALDVLAGTVLGRCMRRLRSGEFIRFLNAVEVAVPSGKAIRAILDNVATHKHPKVRDWLARHPRWTFHFTPTSASWLNAAEGFFSALTRRRLRRGSFTSVVDLQAAIERYIAEHNRRARPVVWNKPVTDILAAVSRSPEPSV